MSNWIGQSVFRVEDERLLKGQGRYLADVKIPGTLEAVFVRSNIGTGLPFKSSRHVGW